MINIALVHVATLVFVADAPLAKYSSAYYVIESDLPAEQVEQLGKILDATWKEYDRRFTGYSGKVPQKLKIKVYATKEEFVEAVKRATDGSKAHAIGGKFIGRDETVYTFNKPDMEHILRHECFHQFQHFMMGGKLDAWVNEGLAVYFEVGRVDPSSGTLLLGQIDPHYSANLSRAKEKGKLMSVDQILQISGRDWHENLGTELQGTQYAQAWALCHFLIHGDGGEYQKHFDDYLRLVDEHQDGSTAFERAFGDDTKPLQEKYDAYIAHLIATAAAEEAKKIKPPNRKGN